MKKYLLAGLVGLSIHVNAQTADAESLGLPGDNLDLYAVLDLFKSSASVEDFEKSLNDEKKGINNLDLNEDGKVDYISVRDNQDNDSHTLTLRVAVNATESQDVACIAIEKTGKDQAVIQAIGDEDLYGKDYFIEPSDEGDRNGGKGSSGARQVYVNVWFWPCVQFVYAPAYVIWISPWYWEYYPVWWSPWSPVGWGYYHPHVAHHHAHYIHVHACHVPKAYNNYHTHRVRSVAVGRKSGTSGAKGKVNESRDRKTREQNDRVRTRDTSPKMEKQQRTPSQDKKSGGSKERSGGRQGGNQQKSGGGGKSGRK